jgi:hypothetical protein
MLVRDWLATRRARPIVAIAYADHGVFERRERAVHAQRRERAIAPGDIVARVSRERGEHEGVLGELTGLILSRGQERVRRMLAWRVESDESAARPAQGDASNGPVMTRVPCGSHVERATRCVPKGREPSIRSVPGIAP